MALYLPLRINDDQISFLRITRLRPLTVGGPDTICEYEWFLEVHGESIESSVEPVRHRYGDGAWALVARVLAAAGYPPSPDGDGP